MKCYKEGSFKYSRKQMDFVKPVWDNSGKWTVFSVCVQDCKRIIGLKFRQVWYWLSFLSLKLMKYYNRLHREVVNPRKVVVFFFLKIILHERHIPSISSWKKLYFPSSTWVTFEPVFILSFLLTWSMLIFMKKMVDKISFLHYIVFILFSFIYLAALGLPCGTRNFQLWHANPQLWHVGSSSLTRDQTQASCIGTEAS